MDIFIIIVIIYSFRTRGTYHVQCIQTNLRMQVRGEKTIKVRAYTQTRPIKNK